MKRRNSNGFDVLTNILESVGVKNMVNDSEEDSDDDSCSEITVNWVQRVLSDAHTNYEGHEMCQVPPKKTDQTYVEMSKEITIYDLDVLPGFS